MNVEKHPGPFIGPDIELARACAMAVIPWYGNDDAVTHQRIMQDGVWNDHVAVQAALAAIHHYRRQIIDEIMGRLRPLFNPHDQWDQLTLERVFQELHAMQKGRRL